MFKQSFKYYKSKSHPPDLNTVLDFNKYDAILDKINIINLPSVDIPQDVIGLKSCPEQWKVYELKTCPGLILIENPFTPIGQRYWTIRCLRDLIKPPNKTNVDDISNISKLRWATFGYHHNWDTKIYSEDSKSDFPEDLSKLTEFILNCLLNFEDFHAEAAIANYYHMDSTLAGHTDHSEVNLEAPLISISFGQSAIFLIGGKTLDEEPSALFLKSGDIVVMSGESRLAYHAVPKIVKTSENWRWNVDADARDQEIWRPYEEYLLENRINLNVRQVLGNKKEKIEQIS